MKVHHAFHRGDPVHSFHGNEIAEIVGVRLISHEGSKARPCFVVRHKNGDEDYVSIVEALERGFICKQDGTPAP